MLYSRYHVIVLLLILAPSAAALGSSGQEKRQSSARIVAFGEDAEPAKAEASPEKSPATIEGTPRKVLKGSLVPPPPRVVLKTAVDRFEARPAATTSVHVNSSYGVRFDPITGLARMHTGVDLRSAFGQSVGSSMSGTILHAGPRGGYGNLVIVDHGNGISTYYAHLSQIAVATGQSVEAGEFIGLTGSTGRSTGPHLHYEVRVHGNPLDPTIAIELDRGRLLVHGTPIQPGSAVATALPKAPGGTRIALLWGPRDVATPDSTSTASMQVDFE